MNLGYQEKIHVSKQVLKKFSQEEDECWTQLFDGLSDCRKNLAYPMFSQGLRQLGIDGTRIPNLEEINSKLKKISGWEGVPVEGFVKPEDFFEGLCQKQFPVGDFIRDASDIAYTPAPDVFHDMYGHLPFFAFQKFGAYCEKFGKIALRYGKNDENLQKLDRLFWFGIEFPLIDTPDGIRIFGGGILSSKKESEYSLSTKPKVIKFDVEQVCSQNFVITELQSTLFVYESLDSFYNSINQIEDYFSALEDFQK